MLKKLLRSALALIAVAAIFVGAAFAKSCKTCPTACAPERCAVVDRKPLTEEQTIQCCKMVPYNTTETVMVPQERCRTVQKTRMVPACKKVKCTRMVPKEFCKKEYYTENCPKEKKRCVKRYVEEACPVQKCRTVKRYVTEMCPRRKCIREKEFYTCPKTRKRCIKDVECYTVNCPKKKCRTVKCQKMVPECYYQDVTEMVPQNYCEQEKYTVMVPKQKCVQKFKEECTTTKRIVPAQPGLCEAE